MKTLEPGRWEVPHDTASGRLGFLMLDGLLARDVVLGGTPCTELLGEGDVIQPWIPSTEDGLVRYRVLWHVLAPSRLAVLDDAFARTLADWPQVMAMLLERAIRRTLRMSIHQALLQLSPVETRLLVLFWHLAERWGRVTPDGISVRLRMSHELLGQLVGCRRASVTTALHRWTTAAWCAAPTAPGSCAARLRTSWLTSTGTLSVAPAAPSAPRTAQPLGLLGGRVHVATSAPRGPLEQNATSASTASGAPSKTASTAPSRRLQTQPATPRRAASRRVLSRKKTPWTWPLTTTR